MRAVRSTSCDSCVIGLLMRSENSDESAGIVVGRITVHTYHGTYISRYIHITVHTYHGTYISRYIHITVHTYHGTYISRYIHITVHRYHDTYILRYIHITVHTYYGTYILRYIHITVHTYYGIYISRYIYIAVHTYHGTYFPFEFFSFFELNQIYSPLSVRIQTTYNRMLSQIRPHIRHSERSAFKTFIVDCRRSVYDHADFVNVAVQSVTTQPSCCPPA